MPRSIPAPVLFERVYVGGGTPWGTATPFCAIMALNGRTACASHDVASFRDAHELALHLADEGYGACRLGWLCLACGELHGWAVRGD